MKDKFNQILIRYRPQLVDEIDCTELLNILISRNVLTRRQVKSIECIADPFKRTEAVIDALHRRPDEDFDVFCDALIATKQKHIVDDYLRPKSQPNTTAEVHFESLGIQLRGERQRSSVEGLMVQETTVNNTQQLPVAPTDAAVTTQPPPQPEWKLAGCPTSIDNITVVPSTQQFYETYKHQSYPMSRPCRGKLLLICNDEFHSQSTTDSDQQQQQLSERRGADVDVHNITTLFRRLQFDVNYHNNLTAAEMMSLTREVANDPTLCDDDCFALCVMSHGQLRSVRTSDGNSVRCECVFGSDGVVMPTTTLLAPFSNEKCLSLKGKPKIVIFQACRGDSVDRTQTDGGDDTDSSLTAVTDAEPTSLQHEIQLSLMDFIIGYPTQTGFRSFRNTSTGSWYINAMTRVFAERSCDTDVAAMLRLVNEVVSSWVSNSDDPKLHKGGQCAAIHDSLARAHLFLFPGVSHQ